MQVVKHWQIPYESFVQRPLDEIPGSLGQLAKHQGASARRSGATCSRTASVVLYTTLKLVTPLGAVNASQQTCLFGLRQEVRLVQQAT